MTGKERGFSLGASLALTLGSAVLWGVAHFATGRQRLGAVLMAAHLALIAFIMTMATKFTSELLTLAVLPNWLTALTGGLIAIGVVWSAVIIWSFVLVKPAVTTMASRTLTTLTATLLCASIIAPSAYAARLAYLSRDMVTSVFNVAGNSPVVAQDPWNGATRLNVLLIGADAAANRIGVRTDSMTVASVDTATGATTLLGLPRNLEQVRLPEGPARDLFPYGFTGEPPYTPGLLNEVFQYAEDYPDMAPGVHKGQRGPKILKETISDILGIPVNYYAMVDMTGFAQIIDAMGGVRVTIADPIVYGRYGEHRLASGTRRLSGQEALWYGRSRTNSDDYVRMGRQKCLLNAVAKQADPITVLNSFERLTAATKRAISTDIPQDLLPAMIDLAQQVKNTRIRSLSFVPPLISTAYPDWDLIKEKVQVALAPQPIGQTVTAATPDADISGPSAEVPILLDANCD